MDAGSKMVGFSASFNTGKLLLESFAAVAQPCNDVGKKLSDCRENQRVRRNRKKCHRKARFNNRVQNKKEEATTIYTGQD